MKEFKAKFKITGMDEIKDKLEKVNSIEESLRQELREIEEMEITVELVHVSTEEKEQ